MNTTSGETGQPTQGTDAVSAYVPGGASPVGRPPDVGTVDPASMQSRRGGRWAQRGRRAAICAVLTFVVLGAAGFFGARQDTLSRTGDGYRVELVYPEVTRSGLPASWRLVVRRANGGDLGGAVEVATDTSYLRIFDHHDLGPEPAGSWQTATQVVWRFEPAAATSELEIRLDARIQPDARWSHHATTTVRIDGRTIAGFQYRTTISP